MVTKKAISRIAEPLSRGENVKKLLTLHVSPYQNQYEKALTLESLKSIDKSYSNFLEWFGVLKGIKRPKTTINNEVLNQFLNTMTPDKLGFSDTDISKPMYFNQKNYFKVGDLAFKRIIRAFCNLTGFKGRVDEYSYIFQELYGVDVQIRLEDDLEFIIENTNSVTIDDVLMFALTPTLPQTKNKFFKSPYSLFSLNFINIEGTKLDFTSDVTSSFYFSF